MRNRGSAWILFSYLLFDLITNILLLYFIPLSFHNKVYPIFTFFETLFFAGFFYSIIKKPSLRTLITVFTIICAVSSLIYYYYTYFILLKDPRLDSIPIGIETIIIFLFTFFYFFEQMNDTSTLFIYTKFSFWGVLGIVLYLAGSFFVYILANDIEESQLGKYWIITNICSIIKNVFFTIAIYLAASRSMKKNPVNYSVYTMN